MFTYKSPKPGLNGEKAKILEKWSPSAYGGHPGREEKGEGRLNQVGRGMGGSSLPFPP